MAHVQVHADDVTLDSPVLVEGLPGAGLVEVEPRDGEAVVRLRR